MIRIVILESGESIRLEELRHSDFVARRMEFKPAILCVVKSSGRWSREDDEQLSASSIGEAVRDLINETTPTRPAKRNKKRNDEMKAQAITPLEISEDDAKLLGVKQSGGDSDYYLCDITNPKRLEACTVECEDIIRHMDMSFDEGEALKAIWRNAAARRGGGKTGDSAKRNGEKVEHYGKGMQLDAARNEGKENA
jgi:hypothetical protein